MLSVRRTREYLVSRPRAHLVTVIYLFDNFYTLLHAHVVLRDSVQAIFKHTHTHTPKTQHTNSPGKPARKTHTQSHRIRSLSVSVTHKQTHRLCAFRVNKHRQCGRESLRSRSRSEQRVKRGSGSCVHVSPFERLVKYCPRTCERAGRQQQPQASRMRCVAMRCAAQTPARAGTYALRSSAPCSPTGVVLVCCVMLCSVNTRAHSGGEALCEHASPPECASCRFETERKTGQRSLWQHTRDVS